MSFLKTWELIIVFDLFERLIGIENETDEYKIIKIIKKFQSFREKTHYTNASLSISEHLLNLNYKQNLRIQCYI